MRERALEAAALTDRRSITLPLCVLAAGVVHGLCVAALLPLLIALPGPGSKRQEGTQIIDVEMPPVPVPAPETGSPASALEVPADESATTAALPDAEHPLTPPVPPDPAASTIDSALPGAEEPPETATLPSSPEPSSNEAPAQSRDNASRKRCPSQPARLNRLRLTPRQACRKPPPVPSRRACDPPLQPLRSR